MDRFRKNCHGRLILLGDGRGLATLEYALLAAAAAVFAMAIAGAVGPVFANLTDVFAAGLKVPGGG